jgi:hypothetical protein
MTKVSSKQNEPTRKPKKKKKKKYNGMPQLSVIVHNRAPLEGLVELLVELAVSSTYLGALPAQRGVQP